jgi:release factor glutamine methyltransferase
VTTDEWLLAAAGKLQEAGIEFPQMEAREILSTASGLSKEEIVRAAHDIDINRLQQLLSRRVDGEPLAYILGKKEFFGRSFIVNRDVLIPRPETELLVELALPAIRTGYRCVDVGTGSGCVGITLAIESPSSHWLCTDTSTSALRVAQRNAVALGADIGFLNCGLLDAFADHCLDMVVSNPPYVAPGDARLDPKVARWEPAEALYSGPDGLDVIRSLIAGAARTLKRGGRLAIELGKGQAGDVMAMLQGWSPSVHRDLAGNERVVTATNPTSY